MANRDVAGPHDSFPRRMGTEARLLVRQYVMTRRVLLWAAGVWVVLIAVMVLVDASSWVRAAAQWTSFFPAFLAVGMATRMLTIRSWGRSLLSLVDVDDPELAEQIKRALGRRGRAGRVQPRLRGARRHDSLNG